jgi:ATP-binding cassette, subfamily B, bacterial
VQPPSSIGNEAKVHRLWRDPFSVTRKPGFHDWSRTLANLRSLLPMLWMTSPTLTSSAIALRLCRSPLPFIALWIPKLIIDAIIGYTVHHSDRHRVWFLLLAEILLAVSNDVLARSSIFCESLLADRFTHYVSIRLMRHASTLDLACFEEPGFHDILERARTQNTSRMVALQAVMNLLQDTLVLAVLSSGVMLISPWLMLLLFCTIIPAIWGESRFSTFKYSALYRWTPYRRMLDYLRYLGASLESAKEVKLFDLGPHLADAYSSVSERLHKENATLSLKRAALGSLLNVLSTAGYYVAYAVVLVSTLASRITLGTFVFLAGTFSRSRSQMDRIVASSADLAECAIYLDDLVAFFAAQPSIRSLPLAKRISAPVKQGLEFRNVSFGYPGSTRSVLENVSFKICPGSTLALVGANGAGKSTILNLVLRLYDPTDGAIFLDGTDIREYDLRDLHNNMGVIFQDYVRYDMPVRNNIGFGNIGLLYNRDSIITAAQKSGSHDLVSSFPLGYEQMLGRRFEGGIAISGGEWQRLALARACMRDAQLMIFDEPVASLDPLAEYELFMRLREMKRDRILLLSSHKFSTVRMAETILVLQRGTVIEQGRHEELFRSGGYYAKMFEMQAAGYRD